MTAAAAALERLLGPAAGEAAAAGEAVLLLGPEGPALTALLLRAALDGGAHGPRAVYLAPRVLPGLPPGADPRALQRLELRYPASRAALARELAALRPPPGRPPPPLLLLLDGLERYAAGGGGGARGGARLGALLREAAPPPPAALLAALRVRGAAPPPALRTLRRYCGAQGRLHPRPGDSSVPRCWRLPRDVPHGDSDEEAAWGECHPLASELALALVWLEYGGGHTKAGLSGDTTHGHPEAIFTLHHGDTSPGHPGDTSTAHHSGTEPRHPGDPSPGHPGETGL